MAKKLLVRNVKGRHYVIIDYPEEGESIRENTYTVRIGTSKGASVEVSIDGGEWMFCRKEEGFWWFDWDNYSSGFHEIKARLRKNGKILKNSIIRRCKYQI